MSWHAYRYCSICILNFQKKKRSLGLGRKADKSSRLAVNVQDEDKERKALLKKKLKVRVRGLLC